MSKSERNWLLWCVLTFTSFLALEARAIYKGRPEDTLTYFLRKALGIDPEKPWRVFGVAAVMSGCCWVAAHLATGKLVPRMLRASGKEED